MADMIIAGERISGHTKTEVRSPFDGTLVDSVPKATAEDCERALAAAYRATADLKKQTGRDRSEWLSRSSTLLEQRSEDFAETISREEGKTIAEARAEVARAVETLTLSSEEAKRLCGTGVPLHGAPGAGDRLGFTVRVPCGVVVAISPFNFPLNLVAHKVGPALAGGNAVILKPASATPLTAIKLCELMLEAGVPPQALSCLTGPGGSLGKQLVSDRRVRKISFTGSVEVGNSICQAAGAKRVTMELGGNAPIIVLDDADLDLVVKAIRVTGFGNAGQVCISAQRILATKGIHNDILDALGPAISSLRTGDPFSDTTDVGPMINENEAARVANWIAEATSQGAQVVVGGDRSGAMHQPTLIAEAKTGMRILEEELFGPAVAVAKCDDIRDALSIANQNNFGLAASIFTCDIGRALAFIETMEAGNLHINWGPGWRADLMPYGGLKGSGFGKEGPAFAIKEMTEEKMVIFHPTH